ncbi:MAG: hypothetical protein RSC06_00855 [Clostridia bacterium]
MSANTFGSWNGTTTAGADMLEVLKEKENSRTTKKRSMSAGFSILQLGISAPENTVLFVNGEKVTIPKSGVFQLGYGLVEIESLVFEAAVTVSIVYVF